MATTKTEISKWFDEGVDNPKKPTHMIIVCDTYDWEDYPVYVMPNEKVLEVYKDYNDSNMQKVMEIYNLNKDKNAQINSARNFNV